MSAERGGTGQMVTLTIDGREIRVPAGTLIIRAAERLGLYVPRFCDHPALAPLGACRQCMVEVEGQHKPLTACTTPVAEKMVVRTQAASEMARDAQEAVLEFLLINHPLDCPMCDKGGECPLQDQALAYGPGGSRMLDPKRRFEKPIPISPLVLLDRERCVLCARCTRFASEISGDPFIELFERGALEQVAVFEDEPYLSPFSGNIIQICPVGALTSVDFRFQARPFDMTTTRGACNLCASGCRTLLQERRGRLVRILADEDPEVNEYWTCDKGRFGYGYVHHPNRVVEPLVRKGDELVAVSWAEAARTAAERIAAVRRDEGKIGVLAGGNLPDADAYALSRFARTVLATNHIDARLRPGVAGGEEEDEVLARALRAPSASYADIDAARVIITAGLDAREESPILFLRLRQALVRRGATIIEVGGRAGALAREGALLLRCVPGGEAAALQAAAGNADAAALDAAGVERMAARAAAKEIAAAGDAVVVLAGERLASAPGALTSAWNLACATGGRFGWVPRRAGARGAWWAGLHPRFLPGLRPVEDPAARAEVEGVWGAAVPAVPGHDARTLLADAASLGVLYLVGADPVADLPGHLGSRGLGAAQFVVAQDLFLTESTRRADVVLPAAAVPERSGHFSNWEGRRAPFRGAVDPPGLAQPDSEIFAALGLALGVRFPATREALEAEIGALVRPPLEAAALDGGTPAGIPAAEVGPGGLRLLVVPLLLGAGTMLAGADALRASAPPPAIEIHPDDARDAGIVDAPRVRVSSIAASVEGPMRVSTSVGRGVVFAPANHPALRGLDLLSPGEPFPSVRIEGAD